MRIVPAALLLLLTAGCDRSGYDQPAPVDVNAVAEDAQGDIDTYAANTLEERRPAPKHGPRPDREP